jgi:ATP-dependent helicase STH1/SNF2
MLEADQEEDTDESASMNDDEINLIIARTDEEITIFKRMDGERDIKEDADWMKSGGRGPKPDRLMQFQELPEVYQRDEPKTPPPEIETFNFGGRSQRARKEVIYNDGLTDDQWVAVSFTILSWFFRPSH